MVAATMKISEYVVVIYNFQTGIANRSVLVKKHCFIAKLISWPWEGAIQHKEFIIYNFIILYSISTGTTINEYCRNAYASNMLIWIKFMTPYQNFVIPLTIMLFQRRLIYITFLFSVCKDFFTIYLCMEIRSKRGIVKQKGDRLSLYVMFVFSFGSHVIFHTLIL